MKYKSKIIHLLTLAFLISAINLISVKNSSIDSNKSKIDVIAVPVDLKRQIAQKTDIGSSIKNPTSPNPVQGISFTNTRYISYENRDEYRKERSRLQKEREKIKEELKKSDKLRKNGTIDEKTFKNAQITLQSKIADNYRRWDQYRTDFIKKYPANKMTYQNYLSHREEIKSKQKCQAELKLQRNKIETAFKTGLDNHAFFKIEQKTEKLKSQISQIEGAIQARNLKSYNSYIEAHKNQREMIEDAKKKNLMLKDRLKKIKIQEFRQSIKKNKEKIKWCRRNQDKMNNPKFIERYKKALVDIKNSQIQLKKLLEAKILKKEPKNRSQLNCSLTKWHTFVEELKICAKSTNQKICDSLLYRASLDCWNFYRSGKWVNEKPYSDVHYKIFHPVKQNNIEKGLKENKTRNGNKSTYDVFGFSNKPKKVSEGKLIQSSENGFLKSQAKNRRQAHSRYLLDKNKQMGSGGKNIIVKESGKEVPYPHVKASSNDGNINLGKQINAGQKNLPKKEKGKLYDLKNKEQINQGLKNEKVSVIKVKKSVDVKKNLSNELYVIPRIIGGAQGVLIKGAGLENKGQKNEVSVAVINALKSQNDPVKYQENITENPVRTISVPLKQLEQTQSIYKTKDHITKVESTVNIKNTEEKLEKKDLNSTQNKRNNSECKLGHSFGFKQGKVWAYMAVKNHKGFNSGHKDMEILVHYLKRNSSVFNKCAIKGVKEGYDLNYGSRENVFD